jgi:hypothetical protein
LEFVELLDLAVTNKLLDKMLNITITTTQLSVTM